MIGNGALPVTQLHSTKREQLITAPAIPAGELVGRPDLTEEDVREAIRTRLAFEGRHGPEPDVVLLAARLGKRKALVFLRKLVLPPPRAELTMPEQPILRSHYSSADTI